MSERVSERQSLHICYECVRVHVCVCVCVCVCDQDRERVQQESQRVSV